MAKKVDKVHSNMLLASCTKVGLQMIRLMATVGKGMFLEINTLVTFRTEKATATESIVG